MILFLAAPAGAAEPSPMLRAVFDSSGVSRPAPDVVFGSPGTAGASTAAVASAARYPVNDGTGATIAVSITAACQENCTDAEPQQIANFVGTLIHGPEINVLTIQLDTPFQIEFDCGYGAEACYYPGDNKIVLSGDDTPTDDGASREFVLAHEYGHHLAQHRHNPRPFPAAIDWGPPHWSSYEHVCQQRRAGEIFPGDEGTHYYEDPGEAFAEAFAHLRFPQTHLAWRWLPSLKPDAGAFRAIHEDALDPWHGRTSFMFRGRVKAGKRGAVVKSFRTPLDGLVTLRPAGPFRHRYQLSLSNPTGHVLGTSRHGLGHHHQLTFTVCGQSRLRAVLKSARRSGSAFRLRIQRP